MPSGIPSVRGTNLPLLMSQIYATRLLADRIHSTGWRKSRNDRNWCNFAAHFRATTALLRHLEIHAAIVIHLDRRGKVELGEWNLLRRLLIEHPERFPGDRVIPHFFYMLVAENQRCRGFLFRLSRARFGIRLQTIDLSAQSLYVALQSAVLTVWSGIRRARIGVRSLIFSDIFERILVPAVITSVGIITCVQVIEAPPVKTSVMIREAVSDPRM